MSHPSHFQMKTANLIILIPVHCIFENGFAFSSTVGPKTALEMIRWIGKMVKYGRAEHIIRATPTPENPETTIEVHFESTRDAAMFKLTFAKMENKVEMSEEFRKRLNDTFRAFNEQVERKKQELIISGVLQVED
jgi:hypothetical protein